MRSSMAMWGMVVITVAGCSAAAPDAPSPSSIASAIAPSASETPSGGWRWTEGGVHIVDGYYVGEERSCRLPATSGVCRAAVEAATAILARGGRTAVVAAATAVPPSTWVDANGKTHHLDFGGLATPNFAVLTLDSGVRRVILLSCMGDVYTQAGPAASPKLHQPAVCSASGPGLLAGRGPAA